MQSFSKTYGPIFLALSAAALMACTGQSPDVENTDKTLRSTSNAVQNLDWALHGNDFSEKRYSQLNSINEVNIGKLGVAWYTDIETRSLRGVEATPIVVDGVMYVTGPWSVVVAMNAVTGDVLWEYNPEVSGADARKGCCDVVNRGVAVANGKVISGIFDGRLVALDQKTGEVYLDKRNYGPN